MIRKFYRWLLHFFRKEKLYKYKYEDDVPDKLHPHTLYIVGNEGYYWQAVVICPCGCNKPLHMNLMKEHHPSWKVEIHKKDVISLHPSIDRKVGCKSHFFIREGKIVWA